MEKQKGDVQRTRSAITVTWLPVLGLLLALPWVLPLYHTFFYEQNLLQLPLLIAEGLLGRIFMAIYYEGLELLEFGSVVYWVAKIGYLGIGWMVGWLFKSVILLRLRQKSCWGNILLLAVIVNAVGGGVAVLFAPPIVDHSESCIYSISQNHKIQFKTFATYGFDVVADDVFFLETRNGGETWQQRDYYYPSYSASRLCANAHHLDNQMIWTWDYDRVYVSLDGGKSWAVHDLQTAYHKEISQVDFQDYTYARAILSNGVFDSPPTTLITEDSGKTWRLVPE